MSTPVRVAGIQMDVVLKDKAGNLSAMMSQARLAAGRGAKIVVFPECALSGYGYDTRDEALEFAETIPGPATGEFRKLCNELKIHVVFGLLERAGERLFNAQALVGPNGVVGSYRKIHLPFLGVDRFADFGDRPFAVFDADGVRVGLFICYDVSFPESARILALEGADLLALSTNWPPSAECQAECVINARASENTVYVMAVNRVGMEKGFRFIGLSKIVDPSGSSLAFAQHDHEGVVEAEIDVSRARQKHLVRVPGKHEIDRLADRRPEMYGRLTAPQPAPSRPPKPRTV